MTAEPNAPSGETVAMRKGLAMYAAGAGEPLLLILYPHGFGLPFADWPLANLCQRLGRRLITFDPPNAFRSIRPAQISMPEMLGCAEETLQALDVQGPVDVVGHSMGGLCAIAFALARPERVKRLLLIGTLAGGPAIRRGRGMPWGDWLTGLDRWRFMVLGMRLNLGLGNLAVHKQLLQLLWKASYADKRQAPQVVIEADNRHRPAPVRDAWPREVLRLDYRARLGEIHAPTLICVGRSDPQAPVLRSEELAAGIQGSRLEIFEHSGHYPFIEEPERFRQIVAEFLT